MSDRVGLRWRSLGLLTIATTIANALSLALSLILSRGFSSAAYGGLAAVLAISVVGSIPAQGEQFLTARTWIHDSGRATSRRAWMVGAALAIGLAALSVPIAHWLTVSWKDIALLGMNLAPLTVTGMYLGVLLGAGRKVQFSILLVLIAAARVVAAIATLATNGDTTMFLFLAAVGAWIVLAVGHILIRPLRHPRDKPLDMQWNPYIVAISTVAGIYVLTSIDSIFGRVLLSPEESGDFAVSTLWARLAFWAPQAVALLAFPVAAAGNASKSLLLRAISIVFACGATLAVIGFTAGASIINVTSGVQYLAAAEYVPAQVAVGTISAALQLITLYALAVHRRFPEYIVWVVCAFEILALLTLQPTNAVGIIAIECIVQGVGLATVAFSELRRMRRPADELS